MTRTTLPLAALILAFAFAVSQVFAGCGGDDTAVVTGADGGDAQVTEAGGPDEAGSGVEAGVRADTGVCKDQGTACGASSECCTANCQAGACAAPLKGGGGCKLPSTACAAGNECCTFSCVNGACSNLQCVADNLGCANPGECCSGQCVSGLCKPLSTTCKTSGNPCTGNDQCCSKLCSGGLCSDAVSFCGQVNDVCAADFECCGGVCTKAAGATLGVCGVVSAPGTSGCDSKGTVCSTADAGAPTCGGTCCSKRCAPTNTSGNDFICQPPSGCSPEGELCQSDVDCCGSATSPPSGDPKDKRAVTCSKGAPTDKYGRCNAGNGCSSPGVICKPSTGSCSASNDCCEPNGAPSSSWCNDDPANCCKKDALGIPRCTLNAITNNCATPIPAGTTCVSSADCCGNPCVANKCLGACVNQSGACTTNADCCTGLPCVIPTGTTQGICGGVIAQDGGVTPPPPPPDSGTTQPDSGTPPPTCALYGQSCAATPCCSGVPCIGGICQFIQ